ncbi:MAG TPA: aminotransferase class I/II-fold pyridoxal phosphate-dependent enzyme, partial [Balneolaceae bacterium]|nr:aminotransferase class I/II-fold pyridoxal phosphate-dependent enzyme [Balneolaceae bacterium]
NDPFGSHVMPIYQTSTFSFESVESGQKFFAHEKGGATHAYTRLGNPTTDRLEEAFAKLEGGQLNSSEDILALAFGSGMAAISTALIAVAKQGSIVSQPTLYGCTGQFLKEEAPELGITVHFEDLNDPEALENVLHADPDIKVIYGETMANPTMEVCNIPAVASIAKKHDVIFMVDNTFASPYHVRPLELGADIVLHSSTKYLNGHGTIIGGALIAKESVMQEYQLPIFRKNLGGILGPFEAWLNLNGLKTFSLRMQRHAENTMKVAEFLDRHDSVSRVHYPGLVTHPDHTLAAEFFENGFGGVISFELKGGYDAGVHLMDHVKLCSLAVSLGTVDTLIQHPASMTHSVIDEETKRQAGITDGLIRLAVGIEKVDDIIEDLKQALEKYKPATAVAG